MSRTLAVARAAAIAFAVAAIAAPAVVLRLWHLDTLGFNSDEAVYAGQAAAIVHYAPLDQIFPLFRAHPLLFQVLISIVYQFHVSDFGPRLLAVAFGLATVVAGFGVGSRIYGRTAGILTALFLALMPYLVVVNRQALLDGPMVFFSLVALWLLAKFVVSGRPAMLYAAGAALGLAFLTKETAVLLVPAVYAFLSLTPSVRVRVRDLLLSLLSFGVVAVVYPLTLALAGGSSSGKNFLTWQLFRPPNHTYDFYLAVVPPAIGLPVVALAVTGVVWAVARRRWSWRESLLACWIVVPFFFFELWPVKGFQYLLPVAPAVAVLAAGLVSEFGRVVRRRAGNRRGLLVQVVVAALAAVSLAAMSWTSVNATGSTSFLAGSGGVPGGRPAGLWTRANTPAGSEMLSIGPSMANIIQFYGQRKVLALSVSPNPLHRNPAYQPVTNPDLLLRTGQVQYLVWDAYSAARTSYFTDKLMTYVRRYRGRIVHQESVTVSSPAGPVTKPVIIIYQVRS